MPMMLLPPASEPSLSACRRACRLVAGERRHFQPRRAAIEHQVHALARQDLAALVIAVALGFFFLATLGLDGAPLVDLPEHALAVLLELRAAGVDLRFDDGHVVLPACRPLWKGAAILLKGSQ